MSSDIRGYAGKFLDIYLTDEKIDEVTYSDRVLRDYIGGRGLAAKVLWDRLRDRWEEIEPPRPDNILLSLQDP